MEDEGFVPLKKKLQRLGSDEERIAYLESYLSEHKGLPLGLLATIQEWLAVLHDREGRPRGSFYQKAASTWEMIAVLEEGNKNYSNGFRKGAFRQALKDYKRAYKLYKKADLWAEMQDVKVKERAVREELRKYGGPAKVAGLLLVAVIIFSSIFFLSGPPTTGFVAFPLEENETTATGIFLAILGIVGTIFVLWKWR
ncbi:MAG: hypothetical protein ABIH92_04250 [Nanoarchaeota archaeon]